MAKTTKRRLTDEFKREAVALWETSGRTHTEVAGELGIMPTMLRRWQRKLHEGGVPANAAAKPPVSMASPADQASEIARLRRDLDRARMERDMPSKNGRLSPAGRQPRPRSAGSSGPINAHSSSDNPIRSHKPASKSQP